jgi:RNA polymerase sigma factor (sigma-70 family)
MSRSFFRSRCLLQRAKSDPDAFADFYDAYSVRTLQFFARRVRNSEVAFDLMAETFAIALERRHQFRGRTTEEEQGWLFSIARSELSHYWRRGAVERRALLKLGVEVPVLTGTEMERIEELADVDGSRPQLLEAIRSLPEDQRVAIKRRVVDEVGYGDLAAELGVSEEVVRARVSRGLRTLERELEELDPMLESRA